MTIVVPSSIRVLMPNGRVTEMKLETYLAGAVVTEMGTNAPLEALKAQAVASRTYAAAAHRHSDVGADVCTTAHCQEWKRVDPIVAPEVFRAVSETWGTVAAFDGRLIDAFFFEHCDGHTRSAADVHMSPVSYLQSVLCDCGFMAMKGHGVGLCQRGAIVMARRGASFEEILQHYYQNVIIVHSERERADASSVPATPIVRPTIRPEPAAAHPKRTKTPPPPAHKTKTTHTKPIPARRPLAAKTDKPKEEPQPTRRRESPIYPAPKSEPEHQPAELPTAFTPPPVPPQPKPVEPAAPTAPLASRSIEPDQTALVPLPATDILLLTSSNEAELALPAKPAEQAPVDQVLPAEQPAPAEPVPTVVVAPGETSEPIAAGAIEPAADIPVESTAPVLSGHTEPAGTVTASAAPSAAEAIAKSPTQPAIGTISEGIAEAETTGEAPVQPIEVPAYVEQLNNPALLAELLPEEPVAAEPLPPLTQDEPTTLEAQPCEPDCLPESAPSPLREKLTRRVRIHVDHLPGERMIAGCLSVPGIMITVLDQSGNETLVMSGSAPHYGEGGFETVVEEDGCYVVWIDGEAIKLEVHADTAFIHVL